MSRVLLLALIIASLATIVGCGAASAPRPSTSPEVYAVADVYWTPPEPTMTPVVAEAPKPEAQPKPEKVKTSSRGYRKGRPTAGAGQAAAN